MSVVLVKDVVKTATLFVCVTCLVHFGASGHDDCFIF
jgi:hypothetical protein